MNKQLKSYLVALLTMFILMSAAFILTIVLPCKSLSFGKFLLAPFLNLGTSSGITTIMICAFLLIIGGISNGLEESGFMNYMVYKISNRFSKNRYSLIYIMSLFFMLLGALVGSFEEVVPIVPMMVSIAIGLGFDTFTGMGMSFLAVGCGFATGLLNPFNIGVAQGLVNLPLYSGISMRLVTFIVIYILLTTFLVSNAKKVAKEIRINENTINHEPTKEKGLKVFAIIFGIGLIIVLSSPFLTFLQDYTIIIIALTFLISGVSSLLIAKITIKNILKSFVKGMGEVATSIILILMASSIKYIMEESQALDIIVSSLIKVAAGFKPVSLVLFIYLICLILEIFIPSGSAKAFLLIPLIVPVAEAFGISSQLCILAYAFGDGFSNVFYPTNPALIISLGFVHKDYKDWFKYSFKFQLMTLISTSLILVLALMVNYH